MARHLVEAPRPPCAGRAGRRGGAPARRRARTRRSALARVGGRLREPRRPRSAPALPHGDGVRRGVPVARVHRVLPARRAARAATRRPTGCRAGRWRTARSRGRSPSRRRASAPAICSSSRPTGVAGIFPPGYPLLLAPAFLVGAPMLVGPLLAAALVVATWLLAREIALAAGEARGASETIGRVAVGSLDPLGRAAVPHGRRAAVRRGGRRGRDGARHARCARAAPARPRLFGVAGLAVGFLVATQPDLGDHDGRRRRRRSPSARASAGRALAVGAARRRCRACCSSPRRTTRRSGRRLRLPRGRLPRRVRGPRARSTSAARAIVATLRRLRAHLLDVDNLEPLALARARGDRRAGDAAARLGALVVAGQILLAAPFDARQRVAPARGRSCSSRVLPVEHALIALALARLFPAALAARRRRHLRARARGLRGARVVRPREARRRATSAGRATSPTSRARPTSRTACSSSTTTQGFELAFDPGVPASHGIQAVRLRDDDHDRLLYDSLGHPAIHRYVADGGSGASVTFWTPPGAGSDTWRFEAESDWPPVAASGGRPEVHRVAGLVRLGGARPRADARAPGGAARRPSRSRCPSRAGRPRPSGKTWQVVPRVLERGGPGLGDARRSWPSLGGPPLAPVDVGRQARRRRRAPSSPRSRSSSEATARARGSCSHARGGAVALDKTTLRAH